MKNYTTEQKRRWLLSANEESIRKLRWPQLHSAWMFALEQIGKGDEQLEAVYEILLKRHNECFSW